MKILVTGAAGFIGSNLVEVLLSQGHEIIAIDNFDNYYPKEVKEENISKACTNSLYHFFEQDILDLKEIQKISEKEKPETIIHLAALAGVRESFINPAKYENVNIEGTKNILEISEMLKIKKFIFSSSSSVYGNLTDRILRENAQNLHPISPYAKTKLVCEKLINDFAEKNKINSLCLRFFSVYGQRQRPDLAIYKFAKLIKENKPLPVYGDGTMLRDYTHVNDVVNGITQALKYEKSLFEIVNLGSSRPISILEMIKTLEIILEKKAIIKYESIHEGDVKNTCASIEKATKLLNYHPQANFEDCLRILYQNR